MCHLLLERVVILVENVLDEHIPVHIFPVQSLFLHTYFSMNSLQRTTVITHPELDIS